MKIYLLTYGDNGFYLSKKHLEYLAINSGLFDRVISLGPKDLDNKFKKKYKKILHQPKGGGFWLWKFEIIKTLLSQINENDIVIYCDAGASLNTSKIAINRFNEYIEILSNPNTSQLKMKCENHFIEKNYTNKKLFEYFDIALDSDFANSTQLQAGHQFYKKCNETTSYFKDYEKLIDIDVNLITDFYSKETQIDSFSEHRHDQSIFSLLSKKYSAYVIENETEFKNRPDKQYGFPFLSVRSYGHGTKDYLNYFLNRRKFLQKPKFFADN